MKRRFSGNTYVVEKKGFGYTLANRYLNNDTFKRKLGKVKIDIVKNKKTVYRDENFYYHGVIFSNKNGVKSPVLNRVEFYTNDQALAFDLDLNTYVNINFATGEISPAFKRVDYDVYIDENNKIFTLDSKGKAAYSNYTLAQEITRNLDTPFAVVDEKGKIGFLNNKLKEVCPCVFDNLDSIRQTELDFARKARVFYDKYNGNVVIYSGKSVIFNEQVLDCEITASENIISIFDPSKNQSTIYQYDKTTDSLDKVRVIDDKIEKIVQTKTRESEVKTHLINHEANKLYDLESGNKVLENVLNIEPLRIDGHDFIKYVDTFERKGYVGLFNPEVNDTILSPSEKCTELYTKSSYFKKDGTARFMAAKEETKSGEVQQVWGVFDTKGKKHLDFDYSFNPKSITKENIYVSSVLTSSAIEVKDRQGKKVYIALGEDSVLYTDPKIERQTYSSSSSDSGYVKSDRNLSLANVACAAALGAATGNVGLGIAVYNILNDMENSL